VEDQVVDVDQVSELTKEKFDFVISHLSDSNEDVGVIL